MQSDESEDAAVCRIRFVALSLLGCLLSGAARPEPASAQHHHGHGPAVRAGVVVGGGPFYPFYLSFYWGAYPWWGPWPAPWWGGYYGGPYPLLSAARIQVTPRQTEVYVDGYLAGAVDDFDGFAERLRLDPGQHVIELYLEGHRPLSQSILFQPGETYNLRHAMEPLATGEPSPPRPTPRSPARQPSSSSSSSQAPGPPRLPAPGTTGSPDRSRAVGESGALSIRVQPRDAVVLIDGERWEASEAGSRLVIQVTPGEHRIEIQRDGYRPFTTTLRVRPGEETPLNVSLSPTEP